MESFVIIAWTALVTVIAMMYAKPFLYSVKGFKLGITSRDEKRVLSTVPRRLRKPLLHYLRTLEATKELQDYIAAHPICLKAVRHYLKREYNFSSKPL